ncbi:MAG: hypothetical protein GWN32_00890 [Gemmatimonadetes bacterium]|nr:hypothetical protein [Gemmatimonadota bacterium]
MPEGNSSRLAAKANKLYWDTARPAGRLADELGISRSKFYALIEPITIKAECDECGTALVFSSRSDRQARRGQCPECGIMTEVEAAEATAAPPAPAVRPPGPTTPARTHGSVRDIAASAGARQLWAAALVGTAAGLLAGAWWRRR